jgi:hypothetical protein
MTQDRGEETPDIEEILERWAQARLAALAAQAGEVAALYYAQAARERARRPRSQWGRLGVRVRRVRATRSAPGAFAIEWFTRRWVNRTPGGARNFTAYVRRGTADRYPRAALAGVAQPWELAIAEPLEERFAEIRRLARSVSRVRAVVRQHGRLERTLLERHDGDEPLGGYDDPPGIAPSPPEDT